MIFYLILILFCIVLKLLLKIYVMGLVAELFLFSYESKNAKNLKFLNFHVYINFFKILKLFNYKKTKMLRIKI